MGACCSCCASKNNTDKRNKNDPSDTVNLHIANKNGDAGNERAQLLSNPDAGYSSMHNASVQRFEYQSDHDENGIVYYFGTDRLRRKSFKNPGLDYYESLTVNKIRLNSSGWQHGKIIDVLSRQKVHCFSSNTEGNCWITVDFGNAVKIKPSAYSMRHSNATNVGCVRNWTLLGSLNETNWQMIATYRDDKTFEKEFECHTFEVDCKQFYSKFMIQSNGHNSSGAWFLCVSGFEIYGELIA